MSSNKVKRLSKTITKEELVIEEVNKQENNNNHRHIQRNQTPDNSKCCGLFSCCSVHNNINGDNNSINTDKTVDNKANVNVGLNK